MYQAILTLRRNILRIVSADFLDVKLGSKSNTTSSPITKGWTRRIECLVTASSALLGDGPLAGIL